MINATDWTRELQRNALGFARAQATTPAIDLPQQWIASGSLTYLRVES